jgi:tripartite-type tricarboxylate transporter receptor subunit TctC
MKQLLLSTLLSICCAGTALAQGTYPNKPIRLLIPYAPGGGSDLVVRPVIPKLNEALKTQVLLDNRGGGSGVIASEAAARAAPDGYTLLVGTTGTLTLNPILYTKVPYDTLRDFAPITIFALAPNLLVGAKNFAPRTTQEVIAYAKANPGKVNYGTAGSPTAVLYLEHMKQLTGVNMQLIPYKGTGPNFTALLSGEVDISFGAAGVFTAAIKDGRLKAYGVGSPQRLPGLPDIPSLTESGLLPGFESASWYGVVAPAATPKPIINLLYGEMAKILKSPEIVSRYTADGAFAVGNPPDDFTERIRNETARWAQIFKAAGMKQEAF